MTAPTTHPDVAHGAGERRRPLWPWIALGVFLVLLVVAFFVVDAIARGVARDEVESRLVSALGLPPGTPVEVEIGGGPVLFQLATGKLEVVDVAIPDATFGELTGDLTVHAEGVALSPDQPTDLVEATYAIPEEGVAGFADQLAGLPLESIELADGEIATATTFSLFGIPFSIGMGIEPSAFDGQLVFTPTSISINDETFTAETIGSAPGLSILADLLLDQQNVCIASQLPAALRLDSIAVEGDELVAHLSAEGAALGEFTTKGECPAE